MLLRHSPFVFAAAFGLSGCGLISQDFDGQITVNWSVDDEDNLYNTPFTVDTNSNPDIRDNRDKIVENSGNVRSISINITRLDPTNRAQLGFGLVFMREVDGPAFPPETEENALASFSGVPLEEGQVFRVSMTPAQRLLAADLIFRAPVIEVKFVGGTDVGPVRFDAQAIFEVEFTASL